MAALQDRRPGEQANAASAVFAATRVRALAPHGETTCGAHFMPNLKEHRALLVLQQEVIACTRCPRLVRHRRKVATEKRRMYLDSVYWGKPLPSFGDPEAELLILGLAPAAHGG